MNRNALLIGVLTAGSLLAQKPAADNCAPPPSALAPTLPAKLLPGMGTVHLPITTKNWEAQKFFDQGVAQMHSFWAREAERSFLQAAELDKESPMPWWGVAMVAGGDWRPRFQIDLLTEVQGGKAPVAPAMARARAAAKKAVELSQAPGKATELEKLYIAAVAARRSAESTDPEEDFVKGQRAILAQYPDDVEAQLDLALMTMRGFSTPDKQPKGPGTMEAVEILRKLVVTAPGHPGVHHYVIHGFEGATFAKEAWPSCERYTALVTNIPHAIHMPGHIYSQTGRWGDAVTSFRNAAVNEREWMGKDKLYGDGHHGHNVNYLATSYSFAGRFDDALAAATELLGYKENPATAASNDAFTGAYAQGWFATLRTLVQFRKWDLILDGKTLPEFPRARQEAWRHYARGLAFANKGRGVEAAREAKEFEVSLAEFRAKTKRQDPAELMVARMELAGHLAIAQGRHANGLKRLEAASAAERKLTYTEPPYYPRPVAEAWGQAALKWKHATLAEKAFKIALEQYPADAHANSGLREIDVLRSENPPVASSKAAL